MTTINDVAKEAGVSKSTVSSVLSGKRPMSKEISQKVIKAAKKLDYRPNYFAQSLATKETKIIGLNMKGEKTKFNQFHLSLLNGVLEVCYAQGYKVLVNPFSYQDDSEVEFPSADPVDGQILLDPCEDDLRIVGKNAPTVLIGRPPKEYEGKISYVDNDNIDIAYRLTKHLLELGHKNILFLNSSEKMTVSKDRGLGYATALNEFKYDINLEYIKYKTKDRTAIEYGYQWTKEMFSKHKEISAIIADIDTVAQGVYDAIDELGLKNISVAAFSDDSQNRFSPSLTCANLNAEQLGIEAAKVLIEQCISKSQEIKSVTVPCNIIIRDSTNIFSDGKACSFNYDI